MAIQFVLEEESEDQEQSAAIAELARGGLEGELDQEVVKHL